MLPSEPVERLEQSRRHAEMAQGTGVCSKKWLRSWWGWFFGCLCVCMNVCVRAQLCTAAPQTRPCTAPSAARRVVISTAWFVGHATVDTASSARAQLSARKRLTATMTGTHQYQPARVRADKAYSVSVRDSPVSRVPNYHSHKDPLMLCFLRVSELAECF